MKFLLCTFAVVVAVPASMDSETVLSLVPSAIASVDELPALLRENAPPGKRGVDVERPKAFGRKCVHEERETKNAIMRLDPETKMMPATCHTSCHTPHPTSTYRQPPFTSTRLARYSVYCRPLLRSVRAKIAKGRVAVPMLPDTSEASQ